MVIYVVLGAIDGNIILAPYLEAESLQLSQDHAIVNEIYLTLKP